jgi:peptide/nickel transport system permease protein
LAGALAVVASVIVVTFVLTRALPADPAVYFAGLGGTKEAIAAMRAKLGLDHGLLTQFFVYIRALAAGDLGHSLTTGHPVLDDLTRRLPASLELTISALALAAIVGLPAGMAAAVWPNSWFDHLVRVIATVGVAIPTFFTGLMLLHVFYLIDSLLAGDLATFAAAAFQLALPALTLSLFAVAPLARATRAAMLEVLASDFVRTARAIPLSRAKILFVYAFGNALLPVLTTIGMVFSFLLGANVLVEKVFGWPGIGSYAIDALIAADYAPVQGFVLLMAILYILLNLLIDIAVIVADPRTVGA